MKIQAINHIHLDKIDSTQSYLIENSSLHQELTLVSCDTQLKGHGQFGREWDFLPGNLAFSCMIDLNEIPTLTSLEMALLIAQYMEEKYSKTLKLKWPNDIMTEDNKKVGGILLNKINTKSAILGVGLNLKDHKDNKDYLYPSASLGISAQIKNLSQEIYFYILNNRKTSDEIIEEWEFYCNHTNKIITLKDSEKTSEGLFIGIGEHGQARVKIKEDIIDFYSGSIVRFR